MRVNYKIRNAIVGTIACGLLALFLARYFPGYLTNTQYVVGFILLELLAAVLWNYRRILLPMLVVVFLLAGMKTPLFSLCSTARWVILFAGAIAGLAIYLAEPGHWFGPFHGVAFLCIFSSFASAVVSSYPSTSALKAFSLLLLFIYGMSGARLAIKGREEKLASGLLRALEALIYCCAFSYFMLRYALLGNPNSLGAIMGVVALPAMYWGAMADIETPSLLRRRIALVLALLLLLSSYARAGILAAFFSCLLLSLCMRRYKMFVKGVGVALLAAFFVALWIPVKSEDSSVDKSPIAKFLYKGHRGSDVLNSRRPVWDETLAAIREHPFLGTGFGTSANGRNVVGVDSGSLHVDTVVAGKEHGNSYLAIMEWVGLLGIIPFLMLLALILNYVIRLWCWVRQTGDNNSPALPLAVVLTAGLIHAGFEDWLFAVGYYLCVFFWVFAFMMVDVLPNAVRARPQTESWPHGNTWPVSLGAAASGR
jgi:O-antigen ligase